MAKLKPMQTPTTPAEEGLKASFIQSAGTPKSAVSKVARPKAQKLSDRASMIVKIMSFGEYGTGKTRLLADLLEEGLSILVITTDVGGDGLAAVHEALKDRGRLDLEDNLYYVTLPTFDDVDAFTKTPEEFLPEIYDLPIDMLCWDGFSGFQQYQLSDYVQEYSNVRDSDGNIIVMQYWGAIRNETIRIMNRFLYMVNKRTGQPWHKYVTSLETMAASDEAVAAAGGKTANLKKDIQAPFVQGSAAKLIGPAFDVIIQTRKITRRGDDGKPVREFVYLTEQTSTRKTKTRGVKLNPVEPADGRALWQKICTQLDIPLKGAEGYVAPEASTPVVEDETEPALEPVA